MQSARKRVRARRDWILGFYFWLDEDWMTNYGATFLSQSYSVVMQNQTRSCLSCFRIVSSFILEGKGLRTAASSSEPLWSMERMQAYFCYVKTLKPQLTAESTRWVDRASGLTKQSSLITRSIIILPLKTLRTRVKILYREIVVYKICLISIANQTLMELQKR